METFYFYIKAHVGMKRLSFSLLLLLCGVGQAHSEITLKQYESVKPVPNAMIAHIVGIGTGFSWANAQLESAKQPLIYCEPRKLGLSADNYLNILNREISRNEYDSGEAIAFVLMKALRRTFPCPGNKS